METSIFLCYTTGVLVLFLSSQHVRAVDETQDRDRVIVAYREASDRCKPITNRSGFDARAGADRACEEAFFALDRIGLNECHGWKQAKCRQIPGQKFFQCSIVIPYCGLVDARNRAKTFADCAPSLMVDEMMSGKLLPSRGYIQAWKRATTQALDGRRAKKAEQEAAQKAAAAAAAQGSGPLEPAGPSQPAGRWLSSNPSSISGASAPTSQPAGRPLSSYPSNVGGASAWNLHPAGPPPSSYPSNVSGASAWNLHPAGPPPNFYPSNVSGASAWTSPSSAPGCSETPGVPAAPAAPAIQLQFTPGTMKKRKAKEIAKPFQCTICDRGYSTKKILSRHLKDHERDLHCYVCDKDFKSKEGFDDHMIKIHEASKKTRGVEIKPFECDICHSRWPNLEDLNRHKAVHTDETNCPVCGRIFMRKSILNDHIKNYHPSLGGAGDAGD